MGKSDKQLYGELRGRGIRKKTARAVAKAADGGARSKIARRAVADLISAADEINDRLRGGPEKRSAAAKKAARTRKRKASRRSEAAKRGARTRARAA